MNRRGEPDPRVRVRVHAGTALERSEFSGEQLRSKLRGGQGPANKTPRRHRRPSHRVVGPDGRVRPQRRLARRGFGYRGALPPAASLRDRSPRRLRRASSARSREQTRRTGFARAASEFAPIQHLSEANSRGSTPHPSGCSAAARVFRSVTVAKRAAGGKAPHNKPTSHAVHGPRAERARRRRQGEQSRSEPRGARPPTKQNPTPRTVVRLTAS